MYARIFVKIIENKIFVRKELMDGKKERKKERKVEGELKKKQEKYTKKN